MLGAAAAGVVPGPVAFRVGRLVVALDSGIRFDRMIRICVCFDRVIIACVSSCDVRLQMFMYEQGSVVFVSKYRP